MQNVLLVDNTTHIFTVICYNQFDVKLTYRLLTTKKIYDCPVNNWS